MSSFNRWRWPLTALALVLSACDIGGNDTPAPPLPVLSLVAVPSAISSGQTTTLTWSATNAASCTASGSWSGVAPTSGSQTLQLVTPGQYAFVLSCSGAGGTDSHAALVSVTGGSGGGTPVEITLSASPTTAPVGSTTTLTWSTGNAESCSASGNWSGTKATSGSEAVPVEYQGTNGYYLNCTNSTGGSGTQQAYVTGTKPSLSLSSDQSTVAAGSTALLSWSSANASSCTASGAWSGSKAATGSESVSVPGAAAYDFTLECTDGTNTAAQTVTVTGSAPVVTLSAFPADVVVGKTVTLRWQAQYATSCTASGDWSGALATSGFETLSTSATGTRDFHLSCSNAVASAEADASATATAAPAFPPATAYRMNESHDGVVLTTDGAQLPLSTLPAWTRDLGAPLSYPLIAGGRVFVTTAMPNGGYGNRLYALDAATGATLWGPVTVPGTYFGVGLSYDNGRVFVLMFDGALRAFNATNGAALWTTELPSYWNDGAPTAYGGMVFAVGNYALSGLDAATGDILWNASGGTTDWVSPAVSSEGVYFHDGYDCSAYGHEPVSGAQIWAAPNACNGSWGYTPVLKDGTYYARVGGSLVVFDAADGAYLNQLASVCAPSITGTAMIAQNSGTLSATNLSDYSPAWNFTGDGKLVTAPVVVNDTVFVGSSGGKVFGVDVTTGLETWAGTAPGAINEDSESGGPRPPSGPAAGENLLIFASGNTLVAWKFQ